MDKQIRNYLKILQASPDNVPAFDALVKIYKDREQFLDLANLLIDKAARTTHRDLAPGLRLQAADLFEKNLGKPERAEECWKEILKLEPLNAAALGLLKERLKLTRRFDDLKRWLDHEAEHQTDPAARARVRFEQAELARTHLESESQWLRLARQSLDDDPAFLPAIQALRAYHARLLDTDAMAELAEREAPLLPEAERSGLWQEIGLLLADDPFEKDRALTYLRRAMESNGRKGNKKVKQKLDELENLDQNWQKGIKKLKEEAQNVSDRREASALHLRVAGYLYLKASDKEDEILESIERSLQLDPQNRKALLMGERFLSQRGKWDRLLEFYKTIMERTRDDGLKVEAMTKTAALLTDQLGRAEEAIQHYRGILAIDPDHADAFRAVVDHLTRLNETNELTDLLNDRLNRSRETVSRIETLLLMADLAQKRGDMTMAVIRLESALALDPSHPAVCRALTPMYEQLGDRQKLVSVLRGQVEYATRREDRKAAHLKLSRVYAENEQSAEAFEQASRAFQLDPADDEALDLLVKLTREQDAFDDLVDLLRRLLAEFPAGERRRALLFLLAQTLDRELSDYEAAEAAYKELIDLAPTFEALDALGRLYAKDLRFEALIDVLDRKAGMTADSEERRDILLEKARVLELELNDPERAVAAYEAVVAADPTELEALKRLEELHENAGNFAALATTLTRELNVVSSPGERVHLNYKLGALYAMRLGDPISAVKSLLRVLEHDPNHLSAIGMLEDFSSKGVLAREIFMGLEGHYRRLEQWGKLAQGYEILMKTEDLGERKGELCHRLAEVCLRHRDDAAEALRWVMEGLKAGHYSPEFFTLALEAARKAGAQPDLVAALEERTGQETDPARALALHLSLGQFYWTDMQDAAQTERHLKAASALVPDDLHPLARLADFYDQTQNHARRLDTLRDLRRLDPDPAARRHLGFQIARLEEERLSDPDAAIATLAGMFDDDPTDDRSFRDLMRLLESREAWTRAAEVLSRRLEREADLAARADLLLRLADLHETRTAESTLAAREYATVLNQDPRRSEARDGLLRLMSVPDCQVIAATALAPIFEKEGQDARLAAALAVLHQAAPAEEKPAIALRIAGLMEEKLSDYLGALPWYAEAFVHFPGIRLLEDFLLCSDAAGDFGPFAEAAERKLEHAPEGEAGLTPQERLQLLLKLAEVRRLHQKDLAVAAQTYERVLELDPNHEWALTALVELAVEREDRETEATWTLRLRDAAGEKGTRRELTLKAVDLFAGPLEKPDRALELLCDLLNERENDPLAMTRAEEILLQVGKYDDLLSLLERKLKYLRETGEILAVRGQIFDLLDARLERKAEALDFALDMMRQWGDRPEVESLADRLLERPDMQLAVAQEMEPRALKARDWKRVVTVYEVQLAHAKDPAEKTRLLSKVSNVYQEKLGDPQKAFDGFGRIFTADPANREALMELERLAGDLGAWRELALVYEKAGDVMTVETEAVETFIKAARLYEDLLALQDDAIRAWRRVLTRDAENETAIDALENLCRKTDRWEDLRDILLQRAERAAVPERKRELLQQVCDLYEDQLNNPFGATPTYEQIQALFPKSTEIVEKLLGLYSAQGLWRKRADLLGHKAQLQSDPARRFAVAIERARLLEDRLNAYDEAKDLYIQILRESDTHPESLEGALSLIERNLFVEDLASFLEPLFERQENWHRLIDMREHLLAFTTEPSARLDRLMQIAHTYEMKLAQPTLAFAVYTRAFREQAADPLVQSELERLGSLLGQIKPLCSLYEEQIAALDPEHNRDALANLLMNLGHLNETYSNDLSAAAGHYRWVLDLQSDHAEALNALERVYMVQKEWAPLVDILGRKADLAQNLEDRKSLLFKVATIQEEEQSRNLDAIATLRRLLDLDPAETDALTSLVRLTTAEGQWDDLLDIRRRQVDLARSDEEKRDLRAEGGLVLWRRLNRHADAIAAFSGVLDEDPAHLPSREALEGLLLEPESENASARVLEPIFEREGRTGDLIRVLRAQTRHAEGETKRDLFRRMSNLAESKLADAGAAFEFLLSAFQADPVHAEIRSELERLGETSERLPDLANAYFDLAQGADSAELQLDAYLNAGRLTLERLDNPARAEGFFVAARSRQADNAQALDALQRIYERVGKWRQLVEILFAKAQHAPDPSAAAGFYLAAAEVRETKMEDKSLAVDALRKVQQVVPDHPAALERLDRLLGDLERYSELRVVLTQRIALEADDRARIALTFRLGELLDEKLDLSGEAVEIHRGILAESDEHEGAIGALFRLMSHADLHGAILGILDPLLDRKGWWERLVTLLGLHLDALDETPERIEVLRRIKGLYEESLNDTPRAFETATRIFAEDSLDASVQQDLERLAVLTGGFERLTQTYEDFLSGAPKNDVRIAILWRLAELYDTQLEDPDRAADRLGGILRIDPRHEGALQALDALFTRLGRYSELAELIPQEVALCKTPKDALPLKMRLGSLWEEKLADPLTAIDVYTQILSEHPDHPDGLAALERLYQSMEMWSELLDVYKAQVRIARGDAKKAKVFSSMAAVMADRLGQAREAIPLLNRVMQFDQENEEVAERLEQIYLHEQMWEDLVNQQRRRLRQCRTPAARAAVLKRTARIQLDHLNQVDQAALTFQKALELTPGDMEIVDSLEEIYLRNQSWRELADLLNRLLAQAEGDSRRAVLVRLAGLHIERLKDWTKGEELARKALALSPTADEIDRLLGLFEGSTLHELHLDLLTRRLAQETDLGTRIGLRFRMADLSLRHLGDENRAIEILEQILTEEPTHLLAAETLEPLYRRRSEWEKLLTVLRIRLSEASGEAEKIDLLDALADLAEHSLAQPETAFEFAVARWELAPHSVPALDRAQRLAEACSRTADMARRLDAMASLSSEDPKHQKLLLLRLADLNERVLNDLPGAAHSYQRILEIKEFDSKAVNFLDAWYEKREEWPELVSVLQLKVPHMNSEEKVRAGLRVAMIFDSKMGATDRAVKTLKQVLKMDAANAEAQESLIAVFEREGRTAELVEMLRQKLTRIVEPAALLALRLRIARLYRTDLDDLAQAKVFYKAAAADDPQNETALLELERIYEAEKNFDELLEVLSRRVTVVRETEEKVGLYRKMAHIWESHFEQRDMAVAYLDKILAIQPNDARAIEHLEKLHRENQDWPALADVLRRHIENSLDSEEIVRLYTELGRLLAAELFAPHKAIECYQNALKIDDGNVQVLSGLADLYLVSEKWSAAISTLEKLALLTVDKRARVEVLSRLARIYHEHLKDLEKAREVYDRMLAEDPEFVPALKALRHFYRSAHDWRAFRRMVEQEKRLTTDPHDRAELLFEEGQFVQEQEQDTPAALKLYAEAARTADFPPALIAWGRLSFEQGDLPSAQQAYRRLLDLGVEKEEGLLSEAHYRLAHIAEEQKDDGEALKHFTQAYRLNADHLPTLEGLARTLYRRGDWERAVRAYQTILARFRARKTPVELVDLFCRLGEISFKMGQPDAAARMMDKALELDPNSERALLAAVEFHEAQGAWKQSLPYRGRLLKILKGDALFNQWKVVGDIYTDHLHERDKGLEAYRHALSVKSDDLGLLRKVADLLIAGSQWADAIGVLRAALGLAKENGAKIELNLTLARLVREHGQEKEVCLLYYNAALDIDPTQEAVFQQIESFLTERQDWDALDGALRRMIARVPAEDKPARLAYWFKLGNLLTSRSDNLDDAIKVFEAILAMDPASGVMPILADLYVRSPQHRPKAIAMQEELRRQNPDNPEPYAALFKIHLEGDEFDRAYGHAAIHLALGGSDPQAAEFFRDSRKHAQTTAKGVVDRVLWGGFLLHPDARHNIGQILSVLFHNAPMLMPSDLRKEGLKKKDRVNLDDHTTFCNAVLEAFKVLSLPPPMPEIYRKDGFGPGIKPLPVQPATLQIGEDGFENFPERELLFLLGKAGILIRTDCLVALLLPPERVRALLDASAMIFDPHFKPHGEKRAMEDLKKGLEKDLPRKVREPLSQFVSEYVQNPAGVNIEAWRTALWCTAHRAGLLLCNDLPLALEMTRKHAGDLSEPLLKAVIRDLIDFSVSDDYAHLRRKLGYAID